MERSMYFFFQWLWLHTFCSYVTPHVNINFFLYLVPDQFLLCIEKSSYHHFSYNCKWYAFGR
jgi:hypothetical protein